MKQQCHLFRARLVEGWSWHDQDPRLALVGMMLGQRGDRRVCECFHDGREEQSPPASFILWSVWIQIPCAGRLRLTWQISGWGSDSYHVLCKSDRIPAVPGNVWRYYGCTFNSKQKCHAVALVVHQIDYRFTQLVESLFDNHEFAFLYVKQFDSPHKLLDLEKNEYKWHDTMQKDLITPDLPLFLLNVCTVWSLNVISQQYSHMYSITASMLQLTAQTTVNCYVSCLCWKHLWNTQINAVCKSKLNFWVNHWLNLIWQG